MIGNDRLELGIFWPILCVKKVYTAAILNAPALFSEALTHLISCKRV